MSAQTLNNQILELYQIYTRSIYSQIWEDNVSPSLLIHVFGKVSPIRKQDFFHLRHC